MQCTVTILFFLKMVIGYMKICDFMCLWRKKHEDIYLQRIIAAAAP